MPRQDDIPKRSLLG